MDSQVVDFEWACSGECNQCSRLNYSAEDDLLTWNIMILILSATVCHLWMMGNITISAVYFHNPVHFDSVLQTPRPVPRAPTSGDVRVTPLNLSNWNAIFLHQPTSPQKKISDSWMPKKLVRSKQVASLTYAWGTGSRENPPSQGAVWYHYCAQRLVLRAPRFKKRNPLGRAFLNIQLGLKLTVSLKYVLKKTHLYHYQFERSYLTISQYRISKNTVSKYDNEANCQT